MQHVLIKNTDGEEIFLTLQAAKNHIKENRDDGFKIVKKFWAKKEGGDLEDAPTGRATEEAEEVVKPVRKTRAKK